MSTKPPDRIELDPLVLRRFVEDDADALSDAIAESIAELRPWMPWASEEPLSRDDRTESMRELIRQWNDGVAFGYAILDAGELVGKLGEAGIDFLRCRLPAQKQGDQREQESGEGNAGDDFFMSACEAKTMKRCHDKRDP